MHYKVTVLGLVQGIGFRPFVAGLADKLNISGSVRNSGGIVTVDLFCDKAVAELFVTELKTGCPAGGRVDEVRVEEIGQQPESDSDKSDVTMDSPAKSPTGFFIVESENEGADTVPFIPADLCTCKDCEAELKDKNNRRFRHPFISCVNCGARYSIIEALPYDRPRITMKDFELCPKCEKEYTTLGDRRHHAQTIACKTCGPQLKVEGSTEGIFALKDIGGFHLCCSPYDEAAVASLRAMKGREAKPFAVMFPDVAMIREYCHVNEKEEELLTSTARPVVLLERKDESDVVLDLMCEAVFGRSSYMGAMLPCNPLQIMLVEERGPLIMTSANTAGGSMIIDDDAMREWMAAHSTLTGVTVPVGLVGHDRPILTPLDDSVVMVVKDKPLFIRRARGYVPNPIDLECPKNIFAAGADLKGTFCHVQDGRACLSGPAGDLEEQDSLLVYEKEKKRMRFLFGFKPETFVTDLHPLYQSVRLTEADNPNDITGVQHHKAHVASVIAEHKLKGEVLGVAFDGTGFGEDGCIWGSEFFLGREASFERVGHLSYVKLSGGDEGARNAANSMYGYLADAGYLEAKSKAVESDKLELTMKANDLNSNRVTSSSMGRLFDAVSAYLGVCDYNGYEGQAPMELEYVAFRAKADKMEVPKLHIPVRQSVGVAAELFHQMDEATEAGFSVEQTALGFHYAVAEYIVEMARLHGAKQGALSGGTFCNRILLEKTIELLTAENIKVYHNEQVPTTDAGLCLGQAWLASRFE